MKMKLNQFEALLSEAAESIAELHIQKRTLIETLEWVRANYAAGDTREINARIDAALRASKDAAP
jgi:hypothetical protein